LDLDFRNKGWIYGGVYDGHGGGYAAGYAAERLHTVFLNHLLHGIAPGKAFVQSYEIISQELSQQDSGTTAVDFLIQDETIYTANAGDARAIVISQTDVSQLTVDHRVDNPEERKRVILWGASISYPYIVRGDQGLMPTRSIGDQYFKEIGVIATPSLNEHKISQGDLMLISATDGLWDFMDNEEVATLARQHSAPKSLLEVLTHEVLINRLGTDNVTIIAVAL